ncbi:MAG: ribonuclease E/G, partial [Pseudomonadota bacterium]
SRTAIFTPGNPGLNISRQIRDEDERARLLAVAEAVVKEGGATADGEAAPFWEDPGLIIRSAAQGSDPRDLAADVRQVIAEAIRADAVAEPGPARTAPTAAEIAEREWEGRLETGPGAFDHFGVWDAIEALRQSDAALPSGGNLRIEPAAALVAVDVNSGGDFSPAAGLKTNIEAARELPRQLRLRGLGGQVVVDFAPMAKKDRRTLEGAIKAALKRDPVETVAHGWTVMGLFELQRKRERRPLTSLI